jgi:signal transduction histidine kinase
VSDVVGTTAYFVAAEAVTNAMKYAKARSIEVSARRVADRLVICVKDDGSGGAVPGSGSGLAGLQDRVAAAGGVLRIESRIGRGTLVEARLPCVS